MPYREDKDLEILEQCTNQELGLLVDLIRIGAKSTETLTTSKAFERYFPQHRYYWRQIAGEIQLFGGNTLANIIRGNGVLYKDICLDVAKHLKIASSPHQNIILLEENILDNMLTKSLQSMTKEEQKYYIKKWSEKRNFSLTGGAHVGLAMLLATILPGGFLTLSITGPAYRITIPAVLLIGSFRKRILQEQGAL